MELPLHPKHLAGHAEDRIDNFKDQESMMIVRRIVTYCRLRPSSRYSVTPSIPLRALQNYICTAPAPDIRGLSLAQGDRNIESLKSINHYLNRHLSTAMAHTTFPSDLPRPEDDGACDHLTDMKLPSFSLPTTSGPTVDLSTLSGLTILFCYPRTGAPNETITDDWNAIPGARGCTPQACSFRDASDDFKAHGVDRIFGASTQDTPYQHEIQQRTHLPYELLSDEKLEMVKALKLPVFEWKGSKLIKRMSMAIQDGKIIEVFYPVFPPDQSANEVLQWLKERKQ